MFQGFSANVGRKENVMGEDLLEFIVGFCCITGVVVLVVKVWMHSRASRASRAGNSLEVKIQGIKTDLSDIRERLFRLENTPKPESAYGRIAVKTGDVSKKPPVLDTAAPPVIEASVHDVKPAAPSVFREDAPDVDMVAPLVVHEIDDKELPERQPETTTWETAAECIENFSQNDKSMANHKRLYGRIGDGTAPFYNYIYLKHSGFCENDTFRSNQIRAGLLDRKTALNYVLQENVIGAESLKWYFDTISINAQSALQVINSTFTKF